MKNIEDILNKFKFDYVRDYDLKGLILSITNDLCINVKFYSAFPGIDIEEETFTLADFRNEVSAFALAKILDVILYEKRK